MRLPSPRAMIGEAGAEAVIPLHRNSRNLALLAQAAGALGATRSGGRTIAVNAPITVTINGGGADIEAQVRRAMSRSTSSLIDELKKAEREDFRRAIV